MQLGKSTIQRIGSGKMKSMEFNDMQEMLAHNLKIRVGLCGRFFVISPSGE